MKLSTKAVGFALTAALVAAPALAGEGKVVKLELKPGKDRASLLITHTGGAKFRLFKSEKQGNVIIEAENLVLPPQLTKQLDSAAKDGPVVQMTPYNSHKGASPMAKLVIQLRSRADVSSSEVPGKFLVDIVKLPGAMPLIAAPAVIPPGASAKDELVARQAATQKSEEIARKLVEVLNTPQEEKRYFGTKVTFEAKDAEVPDIFRLVGESSDLNIIWDPDVEGQKTSLAVKDLPWDQLLDIVIQQKGYKAMVMGNVVRIMTLDTFNRQAKAKKEEISLSDELEPIVMAVIPLSFAEADEMRRMIDALIQEKTQSTSINGQTVQQSQSGSSSSSSTSDSEKKLVQDFKRGRIEIDKRTNSLIVTNTKESVERIRRLIRELDVPVPQVLIDSKIIIAQENFSRQFGIRWQAHTKSESGNSGPALVFGDSAKEVLGGGDEASDGVSEFALAGGPGVGEIGIGVGASNRSNLKAALQLAEINGVSKTVASPRVIVNNNTPAIISDGQTITQLVVGKDQGGTNTVTATLSLSLTPQVTSRGSVQLKKLKVTKDVPLSNDSSTTKTDKKSLETEVLVDSGATLVLGGIYQMNATEFDGGIPVLKDLPFIGQLFRLNSSVNGKSELMVFITPQIIDPEATSQSL